MVREHCRKHKTKILEKFSTTSSFAERIDEWGEVEIFGKRSVLVVREHCQQSNKYLYKTPTKDTFAEQFDEIGVVQNFLEWGVLMALRSDEKF